MKLKAITRPLLGSLALLGSMVYGADTYVDPFDAQTYYNNANTYDGLDERIFSTRWDDSEDGNATAGRVLITGGDLVFSDFDDGFEMTRGVDLFVYESVTLDLDYQRTGGDETLLVQLYNKSTTLWETVATLDSDTPASVSVNLTDAQISEASAIRFISGSGDWDGASETIAIEFVRFTAQWPDNDSDGVIDILDIDDDNDGILDSVEIQGDGACPYGMFHMVDGQLYIISLDTRGYITIGTQHGEVNGIGYDRMDSEMVGVSFQTNDVDDDGTPLVRGDLISIDRQSGKITKASGNNVNIKTFSADFFDGKYYAKTNNRQWAVWDKSLDAKATAAFDPGNQADIAMTNVNGTLMAYALRTTDTAAGTTEIYQINAETNTTNTVSFTLETPDGGTLSGAWGAVYILDGTDFYASNNKGYMYKILDYNTSTPTAQFIMKTRVTSSNDGTSCDEASPFAVDTDGDGYPDYRDLDSDNDGIADNIEGQATLDTISQGTFTDVDGDGLNDVYDSNLSGAFESVGIVPVDTDNDGQGIPDFLDLDSDNDTASDCEEGNRNPSGTKVCPISSGDTAPSVDGNGMIAWAEDVDDYSDVNGTTDNIFGPNGNDGDLFNTDGNDTEVDYRDDTTILPITVSYIYPVKAGDTLKVDFSTATETTNVGFNIYAVRGKRWIQLNEDVIPGAMDSLEPLDYSVNISLPENLKFKKVGIAGVDIRGKLDRHGPFEVGEESGEKVLSGAIDWAQSYAEAQAEHEAFKVEQQVEREEKKASKKGTRGLFQDEVVNLQVAQDAVYRITHAELLTYDIDFTGFKASKIALSFKGDAVARHIGGTDARGKWTSDSYIEFKGKKPEGRDALYLQANNYRLSINSTLSLESNGIDPVTQNTLVFEQDNKYSWTIPGDDPFYDALFYTQGENKPGTLKRTLHIDNVPTAAVTMNVLVEAYSNLTHRLKVKLNGNVIAEVSKPGYREFAITAVVDGNQFIEGDNTLSIIAEGTQNNIDVFYYDKTVLTWDDAQANAVMTPQAELREKVSVKSVKVNAATDYLIIAHPVFMTEALENYVAVRESEGWKVQVVNVLDIYDAYGYGMATPSAIQAYLQTASNKNVSHVQLVGAASYDYTDKLGLGSVSFIPSVYVPTSGFINYTPCDSCMVADASGIPLLAIGRWSVRSTEELENVIQKTLDWERSTQPAAKTALLIADQNEETVDFMKQQETLATLLETDTSWNGTTRVFLDEEVEKANGDVDTAIAAARTKILSTLNDGVGLVSYSGHSGPTSWSFDQLLTQSDAQTIENEGKTTLALPLACYTNYADSPSTDTLAHQFFAKEKNGFVAIYGPATLSEYSENQAIITKVIHYLKSGKSIGEAIRKAKEDLGPNYNNVVRNSNLLGDVTLKLR